MKIPSLLTCGISAVMSSLFVLTPEKVHAVIERAEFRHVQAEVSYDQKEDDFRVLNLRLKLIRDGKIILNQPIPTRSKEFDRPYFRENDPSSWVQDLDGDSEPEIVLTFFTGGAHCCFYSFIYRYDRASQNYTYMTHDWGDGVAIPSLKDLDDDGIIEFYSRDSRFAYAFTSYADSAFPPRIWQYHQDSLREVTTRFPEEIDSSVTQLWESYQTRKETYGDEPSNVRGILAAYLATKHLLEEAEDGWQRIQQVYLHDDRSSFFVDLRIFLRETGYISDARNPISPEAIDLWTDRFFYSVNPQLSERKIRPDETEYVREWNAIQSVMQALLIPHNHNCESGLANSALANSAGLANYDSVSRNGVNLSSKDLDRVADAIFYLRNPEFGDRQIQPGETRLANEWLRIRRGVSRLHPCD
ncbi:hypothetical protein PN466_11135 [Roseofilum reptotaenium CS-1145]|uniref:Uncharacterized protein n=1 Tax=Roseofilum reptotaenium AO1-A TaxID=1925591 RepID=A0A1L9QQ01_9CYAN|nr:hypothetical protein [Roseofilum reptotaenium]MDB9517501.1 hypothetical protein [Roseofilum reptotaenium CS-1145]OJJ24743.1 hypothetical protein BI308_15020 [Roseofilum reptotaenium AO1-A]